MEKLKLQTTDMAVRNIEILGQLFPNCLTETKNADGKLVRTIDFDKLRQELSCEVVEGTEERYQFTWPDKRAAIRLANAPTNKTLRPCREESVDFDNTENLYIEGDNLEVLKLLRENYLGKVKMIYIDPPYNTGNDFVYNDDFAQGKAEFEAHSGLFDEEGRRMADPMVQNIESNGRFHTDWLNMIYPRLKVAKDLLSDDGVIFISIDDKEASNLMKICDELFGRNNFVGNLIWQSRVSISNDDEISTNHNHTLIYSKDREKLTFSGDDIDKDDYINPDNDPRGPWKLVPIDANHAGGDTIYPITNPKTGVQYFPPNGRIWCYNEETLMKLMEDGRIKFGLTDDSSPKRKLYYLERMAKGDCKTPSSILLNAGTTKSGTEEIMGLFDGKKVFDYPKPTTLIHRLLKYGFIKDGDIVLDFFSGSATTAHATYSYNVDYNIQCRYILVQLPEDLDVALAKAKPEAKTTIKNAIDFLEKLGKPHTICEIGKERIRRAGRKIKEELGVRNEELGIKLDVGFRVLKLDESNMTDVYYTPAETPIQTTLAFDALVDNIREGRNAEDLLFQVLPECNLPLSSKIEIREIHGKKVFVVEDGYLIACFDKDINEDVITAIAKEKPYYFVMCDRSIATDNVADNFDQIFNVYSKETVRRIL